MVQLGAWLFGVSLLLTLVLTPWAIRLSRRLGILDYPGGRKIHLQPMPLAGGLAIFTAFSLVLWGHLLAALLLRSTPYLSDLPDRVQYFAERAPELILKVLPVYAGALGIFLLGLIDDIRGMAVKHRLWAQIGLALALTCSGLRPDLGFLPEWLSILIGTIWIVGITNSFNFIDGLDGLSTGVALVSTAALLVVMGVGNQPDWLFFLAALGGTLLGFLRYNWNPARTFLGSSGSLLVGYLIAMATLMVTYTHAASTPLMPILTPIFILAVPIYDTTSVVLIRLLHKRNIANGDQSHFHHRLLRLGFSHRQTVAFIVLIAFAIGLSAVRLTQTTVLGAFLIMAQILAIFSLLILAERVASNVRQKLLRRTMRHPVHSVPEDAGISSTS